MEIKPIIDLFVSGADFNTVCNHFANHDLWIGLKEFKIILKGFCFTKTLFKKL